MSDSSSGSTTKVTHGQTYWAVGAQGIGADPDKFYFYTQYDHVQFPYPAMGLLFLTESGARAWAEEKLGSSVDWFVMEL